MRLDLIMKSFKCARFRTKRCIKLILVVPAVGLLIYLFPRGNSEVKPPVDRRGAWYDFIDPDALRRDPSLKNKHPSAVESHVNPTVYTHSYPLEFNHTCVHLNVGKTKTPICVYDTKLDNMVSAYVTKYATWEEEHLLSMAHVLDKHSDMHVVDLGCNIGVFTIYAAKLGRKVIAVDPVESNLQLLDKALKLGKLRDKVTLIHNAISDTAEMVTIDLRYGNIGGSHVEIMPKQERPKRSILSQSTNEEKPLKRVKRFKRIMHKSHTGNNASKAKKSAAGQKKGGKNAATKKPLKARSQKSRQPREGGKTSKPKQVPGHPKGIIPGLQLHHQQAPKVNSGKGNQKYVMPPPHKILNKKSDHKLSAQGHGKSKGHNAGSKKGVKKAASNKTPKGSKPKGGSKPNNRFVEKQYGKKVQAITLNDLTKIKTFKPTYLKMDVEGWEEKAIASSDDFRHVFDVRYIFMEWAFHRHNPRESKIAPLLITNGFLPHTNKESVNAKFVDILKSNNWPDNVYWIKR